MCATSLAIGEEEGGSARRYNGRPVSSTHGNSMVAHTTMPKVTCTNSSSFISIAFVVKRIVSGTVASVSWRLEAVGLTLTLAVFLTTISC